MARVGGGSASAAHSDLIPPAPRQKDLFGPKPVSMKGSRNPNKFGSVAATGPFTARLIQRLNGLLKHRWGGWRGTGGVLFASHVAFVLFVGCASPVGWFFPVKAFVFVLAVDLFLVELFERESWTSDGSLSDGSREFDGSRTNGSGDTAMSPFGTPDVAF